MRVLALIEKANEVCCRYRIEAYRPALAEYGMELEVVALRKGIMGRLGDLRKSRAADVVILQRKLLPLWQVTLLRNWADRLIFDVDDAIFQRDSNSSKGSFSRSRLARFRATACQSDAVFVGNDYLRLAALEWALPEQVSVVPTCVDLAKYPPVRHSRQLPDARLVWIGQASTLQTLGMAGEYLRATAARMPELEFRQICSRSTPFPGLKMVFRPWSSAAEAAELSEGDIGIAYMPDDSWSLGKCGLKVLQYMAAGLPVVANPVGVHREMIVHGETGFLADTPGEWAEAVFQLASRPELRGAIWRGGPTTRRRTLQHGCLGTAFRPPRPRPRVRAAAGVAHRGLTPMADCPWLVVGGWWLVVGGWWLVVGRWSLVVGGWWLVVGGWSFSRDPKGSALSLEFGASGREIERVALVTQRRERLAAFVVHHSSFVIHPSPSSRRLHGAVGLAVDAAGAEHGGPRAVDDP